MTERKIVPHRSPRVQILMVPKASTETRKEQQESPPSSRGKAGTVRDSVSKHEHPTTQAKMCSFLTWRNIFERFVLSFTRLAVPPNKELRKDEPVTFGALHEEESAAVSSSQEES